MRILRLDLIAFGPFTDTSLELDQGKWGLHLIYGPNEAGKSTALRAVKQLLYGVPHNSSDNFVHPYQALRVGGLLEASDGTRLECVRRKGRSKTLRSLDESVVVEPDHLQAMLNGMDEQDFGQRFAVDYDELVRGGRTMLEGRGELGEILFAAGSGLVGLRAVQQQLAAEADQLFRPKGQNQAINQDLQRLRELRETLRQAQLPTSHWVEHTRLEHDAQQQANKLQQQLLETQRELERLHRFHNAMPRIARLQHLRAQAAQLATVPRLGADFSQRRRDTLQALCVSRTRRDDAQNTLQQLDQQINSLHLPQSLLAHRQIIQQLHTRLGGFLKAAQDRPALVARLRQLHTQAAEILRDLGRGPDLQAAESLRLTPDQRAALQQLAQQYHVLQNQSEMLDQSLGQLQQQLEGNRRQIDAQQPPADPSPLRRLVHRMAQNRDLEERTAAIQAERNALAEKADVELSRLPHWCGTLEQLERLAVPATETIDRFEDQLQQAQAEYRQSVERLDHLRDQRAQLQGEIEAADREQDLPTEQDLARARQRRDLGWQLVRASWLDRCPQQQLDDYLADVQRTDLPTAVEQAIREADELADRLRRQATKVAERSKRLADHKRLEGQIAQATDVTHDRLSDFKAAQQAWRELWQPLGVDPLTPREMRTWAARHTQLVALAHQIRQHDHTLQQLSQRVDDCRRQLAGALQQHDPGLQAPTDASLDQLLDCAEQWAEQLEARCSAWDDLQQQQARITSQLDDARAARRRTEDQWEAWRSQWRQAVEPLGLAETSTPLQAQSVLDPTDQLFRVIHQAQELQQRIEGIDRDTGDFEQDVRRQASQLLPQTDGQAASELVTRLHQDLQEALTDRVRWQQLQQQRDAHREKLNQATDQMRELQAALEAMCREAGCQRAEQLPEVEARSEQQRSIERELQAVTCDLSRYAATQTLEQFIQEAQQMDADQLAPHIEQLQQQSEQLQQQLGDVREQLGSLRSEAQRMDGGSRAAEAAELAAQLVAQIRASAHQYAQLRLASSVLERAIQQYRERHQGPILERAGRLFATLTRGSFARLQADYNDQGRPVLVGVRSDGQTVPVEGMSEGTCDQLYLALRLASLEGYLQQTGAEPLPLIADDLLIKFDDQRAAAALEVLANLSRQTQVILFTHHRHVVELARRQVTGDALFVHELGGEGGKEARLRGEGAEKREEERRKGEKEQGGDAIGRCASK